MRKKRMVAVILCLMLSICCFIITATAAENEEEPLAATVWDVYLQMSIGFLENGAEVTVLEEGTYYHRIDCYDMEGYLRAELIRKDDEKYYVNCQAGMEDVITVMPQDLQQVLALRSAVCQLALAQEGVPYVYGGTTPAGFDCSGFVQYVFSVCGISLSRVVTTQLGDGLVIEKEELRPGDLVVFQNTYAPGPSHIGIYLGEGQIIHAGSAGITVADLESDYFSEHYLCARRVILLKEAESADLVMAAAAEGTAKGAKMRSVW